jgi:predicted acyl esterase
VIEPAAGGAKGKEFLVVIDNGENGKPSSLFLGGHYEDTYVKTPSGWRIATRRLFPPQSGPQPTAPSATSTSSSAPQGQGRNAATSLTPMDYIDIQQLIARSAYALDTAADHGNVYAQLFVPDGVFAAQTGHPFEIKGRAQLAAFAAGDLTHRGPAYVRDYETNYIVYPSRDGATGRVYVVWIEVEENGSPGVVRSGGHYDDVYVKTRDGWRIRSRTFVPSILGSRDVYDPDRKH